MFRNQLTYFLLFLFFIPSIPAFSLEQKQLAICSSLNYSKVKSIIEPHGKVDKFKHCGISCGLALRCPGLDVLSLGALKEIIDVVGPGDADLKDFKADYLGVLLVQKKKAKSDQDCIDRCHRYYPDTK